MKLLIGLLTLLLISNNAFAANFTQGEINKNFSVTTDKYTGLTTYTKKGLTDFIKLNIIQKDSQYIPVLTFNVSYVSNRYYLLNKCIILADGKRYELNLLNNTRTNTSINLKSGLYTENLTTQADIEQMKEIANASKVSVKLYGDFGTFEYPLFKKHLDNLNKSIMLYEDLN